MAVLTDAGTGYSTSADWFDTSPQPGFADSGTALLSGYTNAPWFQFPLIPAETGYSTIADWFDTTPQPDHSDSNTSLVAFVESGYGIIEGRLIDTGGGTSKESWGVFGE